jgi:hypothetical protein
MGERRLRLPGAGPERERGGLPHGEPREGAGQVQHDPPGRDGDAGAQLEEPLAERPHLAGGAGGAGQMAAELLEQDVGRGREEHAEGIRPEPGATRAVQAEAVVELLDPILRVSRSQ